MPTREVAMADQVRDQHGAQRAVAYLMLAAAPFIFLTGVVLTPDRPFAQIVAIVLTSAAVGAGGVVCWTRPHVMPRRFWLIAPFLCTALISGMDLVTLDASTGAQLFYLWPAMYAASFLNRRMIVANLAAMAAGEAVVVFTLLDRATAIGDWGAMALAMTMTVVVVVALRDRADRLRHVLEVQALADPLTGLANRRSFEDALARAGAWAQTNHGRLALLTVDVDHFKKINDTWGHATGDRALEAVAAAMLSVASGTDDVVARMGGDEFVLLLRRDRPAAMRAADAVRAAVAAIDDLPGGPPGVSIGVAVLPDDGTTVEALLAASDAALYVAKTQGRGRVAEIQRAAAL
jgi:diguanylate cyclase (GGDEF)-like protein